MQTLEQYVSRLKILLLKQNLPKEDDANILASLHRDLLAVEKRLGIKTELEVKRPWRAKHQEEVERRKREEDAQRIDYVAEKVPSFTPPEGIVKEAGGAEQVAEQVTQGEGA